MTEKIILHQKYQKHGDSLREPLVFVVHLLNKQTKSDKI